MLHMYAMRVNEFEASCHLRRLVPTHSPRLRDIHQVERVADQFAAAAVSYHRIHVDLASAIYRSTIRVADKLVKDVHASLIRIIKEVRDEVDMAMKVRGFKLNWQDQLEPTNTMSLSMCYRVEEQTTSYADDKPVVEK